MLSRDPRRQAILGFMLKTLTRSRPHRILWLAYVGAAGAILLNGSFIDGAFLAHGPRRWEHALKFLVFFWPTASAAVLLPGFRHVLRIPSELQANWIFQITESQGRRKWIGAVDRFVIASAIAPIYLLLMPLAIWVLGFGIAIRMTVLQLLVSLMLFEMLFYSWQQLPFACSYLPGNRTLVSVLAGYIVMLGILVPMLSYFIATASQFVPLFFILLAWFGGGWLKLRSMRREGAAEARLLYEDLPATVTDLGIKETTYGVARLG